MLSRSMAEAILGVEKPTYAWLITKALPIEDGPPLEGLENVSGPSGAPDGLLERLKRGEGRRFRLVDGDDLAYCEGRMIYADDVPEDHGPDSENDFAPLWDYGTPGLGCVEIQYWKPGKGGGWETL